jgi:ADP-ribosylation factor-binding protein GGA
MEEEEKEAQSAKLQELIRRGGPQDLQEANKLMKVMAGYDTRNKTDWRAKAAEEVSKIQQKARILEEMLQGYKQGDEIQEGDVFEVRKTASILGMKACAKSCRNSPMHYKMRNPRSTRCAKKSRRTLKPWPNFSRSTIAYIGR